MLIEDDADAEKNMDDDEDRQLIYNGAFLYILQYIDEYSAQPDEIVTSLYSLSLFLFKKKKKKKERRKRIVARQQQQRSFSAYYLIRSSSPSDDVAMRAEATN